MTGLPRVSVSPAFRLRRIGAPVLIPATKKEPAGGGNALRGAIGGPGHMQMQDTLRHIHGGPDVAVLAEAFEVAPAKAAAALRAVMREMAWHMERNTLSRVGLGDPGGALRSDRQAGYLDVASA